MPPYVEQLLSEESLRQTGYFDPEAVKYWGQAFRHAAQRSQRVFIEMGLVGVLATHCGITRSSTPASQTFLPLRPAHDGRSAAGQRASTRQRPTEPGNIESVGQSGHVGNVSPKRGLANHDAVLAGYPLARPTALFLPGVLAVAFSSLLIALQCGLLLGIFSITSIPIDHTRADIWMGAAAC